MFIARQPIFNNQLDVYGYELLFRQGTSSKEFDGTSSLLATASVMTGLFESGFEEIIDNKRAFINFDADFLMRDLAELIDPSKLVVEVLEDVVVDEELVTRIIELKKKGYKIALDDFVEEYDKYPLVQYADIIKYDLLLTPLDSIRSVVNRALSDNKILLAEKIETEAEFLKAKEMGFHLFQGYFFSKPQIIGKSANNKATMKIQYIRILSELKKAEPSYQALAEIIEKDVNLAYRVMRIISSRAGDDLVYSIKRALTYMGLKEIERWISILMVQELGVNKPKELMSLSLVRTKFAEDIAKHSQFKKIKYEASMMGLFSTLDAMLDQTMSEALIDISLPKSIKEALIDQNGELSPIIDLIIAYEHANWDHATQICSEYKLDEDVLLTDYMNAVKWSHDIVKIMT